MTSNHPNNPSLLFSHMSKSELQASIEARRAMADVMRMVIRDVNSLPHRMIKRKHVVGTGPLDDDLLPFYATTNPVTGDIE